VLCNQEPQGSCSGMDVSAAEVSPDYIAKSSKAFRNVGLWTEVFYFDSASWILPTMVGNTCQMFTPGNSLEKQHHDESAKPQHEDVGKSWRFPKCREIGFEVGMT
jgi:hypothetical protein